MLAESRTNLETHGIVNEVKPSESEQLVPFIARNKRDGDYEVVMIITPKGYSTLTESIALFVSIHESTPSWCGSDYLDECYTFVRYLKSTESFTITGADPE